MIADSLQTQVKNRAGTAVPFSRVGPAGIFQQEGVDVAPHTISVKHEMFGKGPKASRQSAIIVDIPFTNAAGARGNIRALKKLIIPEGLIDNLNDARDALAILNTLSATSGANLTVLTDGTGLGDSALLHETV